MLNQLTPLIFFMTLIVFVCNVFTAPGPPPVNGSNRSLSMIDENHTSHYRPKKAIPFDGKYKSRAHKNGAIKYFTRKENESNREAKSYEILGQILPCLKEICDEKVLTKQDSAKYNASLKDRAIATRYKGQVDHH